MARSITGCETCDQTPCVCPGAPSLDRVAALAEELTPGDWSAGAGVLRGRHLVRVEIGSDVWRYFSPTLSAAVAAACAELERLLRERGAK
jgi:hypothetical protein